MKKAFLCLLTAVFSFGALGQGLLRWNYPCKPGTDCWNALKSVAERQDACQIKGISLSALTTEELLLITMEHPFFRSYVFNDSPLDGMGAALNDFNGFRELLARRDAAETILGIYTRKDFSKVQQMQDSIEIGEYTLRWTGLEIVMTNHQLLNTVTGEEDLKYLRLIHDKLFVKENLRDFFGGTSLAASALIYLNLARRLGIGLPSEILNAPGLDLFERKLIVSNARIVELLLTHLKYFVNENR